ncbi:MAG: triose-phosphate isomerase [Ruminiclostridium sp.]
MRARKMKEKIKAPFFEIGPKTFIRGQEAVALAQASDRYSEQFGVDIIFTAQYTDIEAVKKATSHIRIYAQHMDPVVAGRGIGAVLPESVKECGADGVMLNHNERPLSLSALNLSIKRAKEVGLETIVCADTPEEGAAVACLAPDIVLVESPLLIGTGKRTLEEVAEIKRINRLILTINPNIKIMHAAGIKDETDVYEIIAAGAMATGSTSGIMKAENPLEMLKKMLQAAREAWDIYHKE